MKILIDINHPAHVHYFKNMIKLMSKKNHTFKVISRNKEIEHYLLNFNNIEFESRGIGGKGTWSKIVYFVYAIIFLLNRIYSFKPDVVISFGTPYPAIASFLLRYDHISINDTEHAKMHHLLTDPFSRLILTPSCYNKNLGKKQLKFNSYMELSYLHQNHFLPDESILDDLGVNKNEKYTIVRFVSWNAVHDHGHHGISNSNKIKIIENLSKHSKVFISSEGDLPKELIDFQIKIKPEKMHDALAFASLFYGESATMASESACLGTPAIYLDNDGRGYTDELEEKYEMVFNFSESNEDQIESMQKGVELLKNDYKNDKCIFLRKKLIDDKIDLTDFLIKFFERYPDCLNDNLIKFSNHNKFN